MKNTVPYSIPELLTYAGETALGADQYGAAIPLLQNTKTKIDTDVQALADAMINYANGRAELKRRNDSSKTITRTYRNLVVLGRENLKPVLGPTFNMSWLPLGHDGSLEVTTDPAAVLNLLRGYKEYYQAHPEQEVPLKDLTAIKFGDAHTALLNAVGDLNEQKAASAGLKSLRNEKAVALRKRIRGLIGELNQNIGPLDTRWKAFGLNQPGAVETPVRVTGLVATLVAPGTAAMKWNAVPKANYYHVFKKVVGVDADYVMVGSPADLDFTIESLPAGSTIDIVVTAVNDGGEGVKSEKATVTTHP